MAQAPKNYQRIGDLAYSKMDKVSAELFCFTYGAMVSQLLRQHKDAAEVSSHLEKMGHSIGMLRTRLIDEMLAKTSMGSCADFKETVQVIARVGFKMFMNINANVTTMNTEGTECSIVLEENPLADFVELPEHLHDLRYSNIYCGVIRGALEMVNIRVDCSITKDPLCGDDSFEMKLVLVERLEDKYPFKDD